MNILHTSPPHYLETSSEIGRSIAEDAIWHNERCNWVGAEPLERQIGAYQPPLTYKALGPDLYAGTSGVALFMAELYVATNEAEFRRIAIGSIRQSLDSLDSAPYSARLSLFSGSIGILFAAIRVAGCLNDSALQEEAVNLLAELIDTQHTSSEFDLMSGYAGAIVTLVVLHAVLGDLQLLDAAVRFGDELIKMADKSDGRYSWQSSAVRGYHNLTGFSHGAAGAAYALLELYEATGTDAYRKAALCAFAYERSHFQASESNWPDFRRDPDSRRPRRFPCLPFWCHGAPGIALSRLRAYELLGDQQFKAEAMIALGTTRKSIESALASSAGNYSLCHGVFGNAQVLLYGGQMLCDALGKDAIAYDAADAAIERFSRHGSVWPCGTHTGETPGLMLGLAGIGHYLLKLYQRSTPAVTILRKQEWVATVP
jgi:lantibiotic modifying enzyme